MAREKHAAAAAAVNTLRLNHKGKVRPRTGEECPDGEYMYKSTVSVSSALDGVGGQRHAPASLPS